MVISKGTDGNDECTSAEVSLWTYERMCRIIEEKGQSVTTCIHIYTDILFKAGENVLRGWARGQEAEDSG